MIDLDRVRWDSEGLVPVVAQDADGRVLMLAYADREALARTMETGLMHYRSRSRNRVWRKGETSGHAQRVVSLHLDCDGDAVLARVVQAGPACHTGASTCFGGPAPTVLDELWGIFADRAETPRADSYVARLLGDERFLRRKLGEEGVEVALARTEDELAHEAADLLFHLGVLLFARGLRWSDVWAELERRRR